MLVACFMCKAYLPFCSSIHSPATHNIVDADLGQSNYCSSAAGHHNVGLRLTGKEHQGDR